MRQNEGAKESFDNLYGCKSTLQKSISISSHERATSAKHITLGGWKKIHKCFDGAISEEQQATACSASLGPRKFVSNGSWFQGCSSKHISSSLSPYFKQKTETKKLDAALFSFEASKSKPADCRKFDDTYWADKNLPHYHNGGGTCHANSYFIFVLVEKNSCI